MLNDVLIETAKGLYCLPGQFYIDPLVPVDRALITHAHGDHARPGHQHVLATQATLAIMRLRFGEGSFQQAQTAIYGQPIRLNDVLITFLPAGHIIGSAQIALTYQNIKIVISGDYKRSSDPTTPPFEVTDCDVFITEATFGLPVFSHPPIQQEIQKLLTNMQQFPDFCFLIGAYALGKCQRLLLALREAQFDQPVYLHGGLIKLCDWYEQQGFTLGPTRSLEGVDSQSLTGKIVICPPSALHDRWSRRMPQVIKGFASGWMQVRARAKQKHVELPLVISDHADWHELTQTLHEVDPAQVWVTHGREEALIHYATQAGYTASALKTHRHRDEEE